MQFLNRLLISGIPFLTVVANQLQGNQQLQQPYYLVKQAQPVASQVKAQAGSNTNLFRKNPKFLRVLNANSVPQAAAGKTNRKEASMMFDKIFCLQFWEKTAMQFPRTTATHMGQFRNRDVCREEQHNWEICKACSQ